MKIVRLYVVIMMMVRLSANENINKVSENNVNINNNGVSLSVKQVTVNKVSNGVNTVNNISDIESRKLVGVSNGAVISIDDLEKEWRDRLNVEWGQRANFSRDVELSLIHI